MSEKLDWLSREIPSEVCLEDKGCPLKCDSKSTFVLSGKDLLHELPGIFDIVRCNGCGLERTSPRPNPATMGFYYPSDYGPYKSEGSIRFGRKKRRWFELIINALSLKERILPKIDHGTMLEIGCSSGDYMEFAASLGWKVDGVEFSPSAAEAARGRGFRVHTGPLETANLTGTYDVIVGWMVMEHLHDPVSSLRRLRTWIKDDGYLVFSIPDSDTLVRRAFAENCYDLHLPNHLYHYNPRTIKKLLEHTGWSVESIYWQRNCNTLLGSFSYWARSKNLPHILRLSRALQYGKIFLPIRILLRLFLGLTRQSGRMEVTARPMV